MESLKEKTAKGLLWGGIAGGATQLLNALFGIVLGRLLTPADYGMVAMLTIFSAIASALQEGGFISALNKRKHVTQEDYNSVFWFNVAVSLCIYLILFFSAPLIARFYHEPALVPLSRFVFTAFVISALNIVPRAYLFRELKVKQTTVLSLLSLLVSGIVGIAMAALGMAYWGLAAQSVVFVSGLTIGSYVLTRWHPTLHFSLRPIREMFGFSSLLIVTNIFSIINNNLFSLLLGRFYGKVETGNFSQGNKWNSMGSTLITQTLQGVAQPVFAKLDDEARLLQALRKLLRFTACLTFPAMLGLSLVAPEFIRLTIGPHWSDAASLLSLLCVWGAFVPLQQLLTNLLIARGRSKVYMWGTILLAVFSLAVALVMRPYGMEPMLRVFVIFNILWTLFWQHYVCRETGLTLFRLLRDIAPYLLLAAALAVGLHVLAAALQLQNPWLAFAFKGGIMAAAYCLILYLSGSVIFREALEYLFKRKKK